VERRKGAYGSLKYFTRMHYVQVAVASTSLIDRRGCVRPPPGAGRICHMPRRLDLEKNYLTLDMMSCEKPEIFK
jgi:hypothetical protein